MNQDQFQGAWRQVTGAVRQQWGKLTDDDILQTQGDWDRLIGRIQEIYGNSREEIEARLRDINW